MQSVHKMAELAEKICIYGDICNGVKNQLSGNKIRELHFFTQADVGYNMIKFSSQFKAATTFWAPQPQSEYNRESICKFLQTIDEEELAMIVCRCRIVIDSMSAYFISRTDIPLFEDINSYISDCLKIVDF